ncbi:MAG TPA: 4-alpha-glucanotransferase [Sandaracinaceae bacterium LLY-WYZ-13_1]|nr:4-alpha-glucanotransferase [Sandaracinaceae bacterium LLY-WYZ-13_1]
MDDTTDAVFDRDAVREGLAALGVDRLTLAIHDASFPGAARDDLGRGSPASIGGRRFLELVAALGFDSVQLGPQGQTSRVNPSPYDGTWFSRSALSIAPWPLAHAPRWGGLLEPATLEALVARAGPPGDRAHHGAAFDAMERVLTEVHRRFVAARARGDAAARALEEERRAFVEAHGDWLAHDALHAALEVEHGGRSWRSWPWPDRELPAVDAPAVADARRRSLRRARGDVIERYELTQLLAHRQHAEVRAHARERGLALFGDVQIGLSHVDEWGRAPVLLDGYRLGAPPSRTNPAGQPWGYALVDPAAGAPARRLVEARLAKLLDAYDALRIDHPHGMVCPWVYDAHAADPVAAVQAGARLFSSPDLPDHPALAAYARVGPAQLDRSVPRYDEHWVRALTDAQVARYAEAMDALLAQCRARGRGADALVVEVLSTCPRPLAEVLARHGLGRFRVTSKAKPDDPSDGYRTDRARPEDWVMLGTHDTPPIWRRLRDWRADGALEARADYLARRLAGDDREAFAAWLAADPRRLALAELADLFVSDARSVMIFFADLFGREAIYNRPGTVRDDNWTLRVRPDVATRYPRDAARGRALSLPGALALALRADPARAARHAALIARLERGAPFRWRAGDQETR